MPDFVPLNTRICCGRRTRTARLIDTTTSQYYVLLAGRWFARRRSPARGGYVANKRAGRPTRRIPPTSLAGAVLPSVAGTPQAQSALIAN